MSLTDSFVAQYRRWRFRRRREPAIDVRMAWSAPGWAVRAAAGAMAGGCLALAGLGAGAPATMTVVAAVVAAGLTLVLARYEITLLIICLAAATIILSPVAPLDPRPAGIGLAGYLALRLTMAAWLLPWRGRAQLGVLLGWRDLVVLGLAALVGAAIALPGGGWWTLPLGAIGLVVAVVAYVVGSRGVRNSRPDHYTGGG